MGLGMLEFRGLGVQGLTYHHVKTKAGNILFSLGL